MSLIKNSILYLISTILVKATTFFLLPFYSYLVSPEEYGYVYMVSASSTLLMLLMQVSIQVCIYRFLFDCKNNDDVKVLFSTVVFTASIFSTIVFVIVWFFGNSIADAINLPIKYFRFACLIPYIGLYYNLVIALLYAKQEAKQVSITSSLVGIANIIIQVIMVLNMENKAMALIISMLLNSIITFCVFIVYSYPFIVLRYDFYNIKKYICYALSQFPSDVSAWLASCTDRFVINKYIGTSETGIYGVGTTIGTIPSVAYSSINQAYVPYAYSKFKLMEHGDEQGKCELVRTTEIMTAIVMVVICFFVVFSNNIINIFSSSYASSFFIVVIMLIASMFDIFRIIYMQPLCYCIKYTKIKSTIWLFSGIANMGLNFFIIPRYGMYGGCVSSLATYIITFGLLLYFGRKAIAVNYRWERLCKLAIISIIITPLLLLGTGIRVLIFKMIFFALYVFFSDKILNLNIYKYIECYVKILNNKRKSIK